MVNRKGIVLHFKCVTTSLFHTTQHEYSSLLKCAPYILGTSIRGALLSQMIRRQDCPYFSDLEKQTGKAGHELIHQSCKLDCPVKPFFDLNPKALYTFGMFEDAFEYSYKSITKIGIERSNRSASEGAIVTIETVNKGTEFDFSIFLLDECQEYADLVKDCIKNNVALEGLGKGKSTGMGKFELMEDVRTENITNYVEKRLDDDQKVSELSSPISITLKTPLVIGDGDDLKVSMDREKVSDWFDGEVNSVLQLLGVNNGTTFKSTAVDQQVNPDFISRFSYEIGLRENRYALLEDSVLKIHFDGLTKESIDALKIASIFGIGEWRELGFGRFDFTDIKES